MATAQEWLTQEISDLLDVGSVGLYEFSELFRSGMFSEIGNEQRLVISREVATGFVESGRASICQLRWPKEEVVAGPFPVYVLNDTGVWEPSGEGLYLALIPRVDR
ncbi:hypothetical protein [Paractinoplanes rishiriensis]|uniref:Uncharacterized protein n=1 Tax=Paractinoplanes rishiriensis TaxID=1050105 RepID=A0A919K6P5_9ACTN|nr:hypothetical protein [Actinoplanes rishiriensis]GIF00650.1 hypothetical protein Ari01nite_81140 [Actinoplanes rishiriensis]